MFLKDTNNFAVTKANTLATARTINGTSFNGSGNITTANWGTARNIYIADNSATNTGPAVSVNGSANATLKLPATIKAALTGNATTATTLATARTINGTSFNGSANITTANWGTARTLTIGNSGKSVNGSGNVSWTLSEIGAAAASHTHSYLPLSGGTLSGRLTATGKISMPTTGSSWISGMTLTNAPLAITTQQSTSSYHPILAVKTSGNHVANIGGLGDNFGFYGFKSGRTENATDWSFVFNASSGAVTSTAAITAPTFNGALNGNATTATTATKANALTTARTINGTSFNGSANITTANWGTARNITIGSTAKSVNGSANVSWSLSEIGAAAASHTHSSLTMPRLKSNVTYSPSLNTMEIKEFDSASENLPDTNWYHVFSGMGSDSGYQTQLALGMTTNHMYFRNKVANTWNGWRRIMFSDETTKSVMANGHWGMVPADGNDNAWIRTTRQGIIPFQAGGNGSLGTSSWPFNNAYINVINAGSMIISDKITGETKFSQDGAWYDPWMNVGCAIKAHGNIAATGIVRATDRMEINGCPISIQSSAPGCGGVWIQI